MVMNLCEEGEETWVLFYSVAKSMSSLRFYLCCGLSKKDALFSRLLLGPRLLVFLLFKASDGVSINEKNMVHFVW